MSTKYAVHFATCVAVIAFAIGLALPSFVDVPIYWYHPVDRAWSWEAHPSGGIAMDFFGRCLLATGLSAALAALTYAAARRLSRGEPGRRTVAVFAVWAIGIAMIAVGFFSWRVAQRSFDAKPALAEPCDPR